MLLNGIFSNRGIFLHDCLKRQTETSLHRRSWPDVMPSFSASSVKKEKDGSYSLAFLFNFRFVNYIFLSCNKIYVQNIVYLLEFCLSLFRGPCQFCPDASTTQAVIYMSPQTKEHLELSSFKNKKIQRNQSVFSTWFKFPLVTKLFLKNKYWSELAVRWFHTVANYPICFHKKKFLPQVTDVSIGIQTVYSDNKWS